MCTYKPIDWGKGVKLCEGSDEQFRERLEDFQTLSFYKIMNELHQNMFDLNLERISINASTLKKVFG